MANGANQHRLWRPCSRDRFEFRDLVDDDGSCCLFDHWTLDTHHISSMEVAIIEALKTSTQCWSDDDVVQALLDGVPDDIAHTQGSNPLRSRVAESLSRLRERGLVTPEQG